MKKILLPLVLLTTLFSCTMTKQQDPASTIIGTWKLVWGMTIKGRDTIKVDYTKAQEMIKIITPTHFSFMRHDLNHGKDSLAIFLAGGGRTKITSTKYVEYLDFFNLREWEGEKFEFDYRIKNDTLTTTGVEKVEKLGVDNLIIETYIKIK